MSQEDLAELCGTHRNSIGRIERGDCDASVTVLSYLYFALGCEGVCLDAHSVVPYAPQSDGAQPRALDNPSGMHPATMVRILSSTVRARRLAMGMSLQSAANDSLIHINSLWSFERGLVRPSITTYVSLLRALEVTCVTQVGGVPVFR